MKKRFDLTVETSHDWCSLDNWRIVFQIPTNFTYSTEECEDIVIPFELQNLMDDMFDIIRCKKDVSDDYMASYDHILEFLKTAMQKVRLKCPEKLISLKDGRFSILFAFRTPSAKDYQIFEQLCSETEFAHLNSK